MKLNFSSAIWKYLGNIIVACVPNLITLSRILLSPIFCVLLSGGYRILALIVFSLGAISDFLDGYIARNSSRFGGGSKFGEIFDPIADKIFSNTVLWSIYFFHMHSWHFFIIATLLSLRDLFLLTGGCFVFIKKLQVIMEPLLISKVCTCMIFLLCFVGLITKHSNDHVMQILSFLSIITICLTSFFYLKRFIRSL